MIEERIIKFINSLDRIMDTWCKLTIRRTLIIVYTMYLLLQSIITFVVWLLGKNISDSWVEITRIEYVAWGVMIGFYFYNRGRNGE